MADLDSIDFDGMTAEQIEALGRELEGEAEAPTPEPTPEPEAPAPEPEPPAPSPEERRGNPEVPLRQLREENRQLQAALQQILAEREQQPQVQEEVPDVFEDPQRAIDAHVQRAVAPLMQQLQQLQGFAQQQQQLARMAELKSQYGPDVDARLAHFDTVAPEKAHLDPEDKLLILDAATKANPAAIQQQIDAQVNAKVEKLLAEKLATLGKQKAPTIDGLPPAKGDASDLDVASMRLEDFDKMTDAQLRAVGRNMSK